MENKIPVTVLPAQVSDLQATTSWQTDWTSDAAQHMPNKVALRRKDTDELLGLMSYEANDSFLAVEVIYIESAAHSNANLLHINAARKRYVGIAKALFAHAIEQSLNAGFDGVLMFKAKTSELLEYYIRHFGARQVSSYDPFRLVIWEDAAERLISDYRRERHE